jgi:glycerate kinase
VISRTVLLTPEAFGEALSAERVATAIGRGLRAGDPSLEVDLCPIEREAVEGAGDVRELLDALDFDMRMRRARAVVVGTRQLAESTLLIDGRIGGATFELATRARQAGVPAYAVTRENAFDLFDARILDLQTIIEARDARALRRAGHRLAGLM